MTKLEALKAGDTVVWTDVNYKGVRHVKIVRVGRLHIYISERDKTGYSRKTGRRNDEYGHSSIMTVEEYALTTRATEAKIRLHDWGVDVSRCGRDKILTIYDLLKPLMDKPTLSE